MSGICEHGNVISGSIKCMEILDLVRNYKLVKKCSAPWVGHSVKSVHKMLSCNIIHFYTSCSSAVRQCVAATAGTGHVPPGILAEC
jgi:hypothetical protein